jgi:hypothetical protein
MHDHAVTRYKKSLPALLSFKKTSIFGRIRPHSGRFYLSSVGKLDQAGSPASACTGLYRQKGKINPGDTGSQPKQLHIRADI